MKSFQNKIDTFKILTSSDEEQQHDEFKQTFRIYDVKMKLKYLSTEITFLMFFSVILQSSEMTFFFRTQNWKSII